MDVKIIIANLMKFKRINNELEHIQKNPSSGRGSFFQRKICFKYSEEFK